MTKRLGLFVVFSTTPPVVVALLILSVAGCKQAVAPSPKTLSDNCATASLLALKAIQRDTFVPDKGSGLVSRYTQEKIDAADVAAISGEERKVIDELNTVYAAQLRLNQVKKQLSTNELSALDATQYSQKQWDALVDAWGKMKVANLKQRDALQPPLDKCFSDFDASLRARSLAVPASCEAIAQ